MVVPIREDTGTPARNQASLRLPRTVDLPMCTSVPGPCAMMPLPLLRFIELRSTTKALSPLLDWETIPCEAAPSILVAGNGTVANLNDGRSGGANGRDANRYCWSPERG